MLIQILCFELVLSRLRDNGYIFRGTITKGCIFAVTMKKISLIRLLNRVLKQRQNTEIILITGFEIMRVYQHDLLIIKPTLNGLFYPKRYLAIKVTFLQMLQKVVTANFVL